MEHDAAEGECETRHHQLDGVMVADSTIMFITAVIVYICFTCVFTVRDQSNSVANAVAIWLKTIT